MQKLLSIPSHSSHSKSLLQKKSHSFKAKPQTALTSFFQPKLSINQRNDVYKQEADSMADRVMQMPGNITSYVNRNWCTDKDAVRERYLKTAISHYYERSENQKGHRDEELC